MYGCDWAGVWKSVYLSSLCHRFVHNSSKSRAKIKNSKLLNMEKANAKKPCHHAELKRPIDPNAGGARGYLTLNNGDDGGAQGREEGREIYNDDGFKDGEGSADGNKHFMDALGEVKRGGGATGV